MTDDAPPAKTQVIRGAPLIRREIQALELLCEGYREVQIAARIGINAENVNRRLRNAAVKLGAQTVTEAAVKFDRMRRK